MNILCPNLSRELIIMHLNIHMIPSGCNSFLPLSERNERFIADQLLALAELGQNLKESSILFFSPLVVLGADKAKDVIDLPSVSREELQRRDRRLDRGEKRKGWRDIGGWMLLMGNLGHKGHQTT